MHLHVPSKNKRFSNRTRTVTADNSQRRHIRSAPQSEKESVSDLSLQHKRLDGKRPATVGVENNGPVCTSITILYCHTTPLKSNSAVTKLTPNFRLPEYTAS